MYQLSWLGSNDTSLGQVPIPPSNLTFNPIRPNVVRRWQTSATKIQIHGTFAITKCEYRREVLRRKTSTKAITGLTS